MTQKKLKHITKNELNKAIYNEYKFRQSECVRAKGISNIEP